MFTTIRRILALVCVSLVALPPAPVAAQLLKPRTQLLNPILSLLGLTPDPSKLDTALKA